MTLNKFGESIKQCWLGLPNHYQNCFLDKFIVMPNHFHGIVIIDNNVGAGFKPAPAYDAKQHSLSEMIRGFKTFSSKWINKQNRYIRFN
jgi:putative transposase